MAPSITSETSTAPVVEKQQQQSKDLLAKDRTHLTPLEAISQGISLPGIPQYSDIDKQRRFILEHMAGAFRVFARKGFTEGMSGHISVRDH